MREYLGNNALLVAEHDVYGIWYFTTVGQIAKTLDIENSRVAYHMKKNKVLDGWTLSIVDDCGDIPFKWINPTREDVFNGEAALLRQALEIEHKV